MKKITQLIFLFLIVSPILSFAQNWSVGISGGTSMYQGDVTERFPLNLKGSKLTYGGFVKFHITDNISLRANYLKGHISGSDSNYPRVPWRMKRGFNFKSPITELSTIAEWDIIKKRFGKRQGSKGQLFSLYVLGGLGYVKTNPITDFNEPNPFFEDVNIDKLAQFSRTHLVLPLGIGIKWHITSHNTLSFETANRTTFTDYLDGISKTAQPKFGDWYLVGMMSFSQNFSFSDKNNNNRHHKSNGRVSCPRF